MKRFKISFLAIIAVLAIGLTAFTKAEPAATKGLAAVPNCYTTVPLVCLDEPVTLIQDLTSCEEALSHPNGAVSGILPAAATIQCDLPDARFCCAQLKLDVQVCDEQEQILITNEFGVQQFGYARIANIYCKED